MGCTFPLIAVTCEVSTACTMRSLSGPCANRVSERQSRISTTLKYRALEVHFFFVCMDVV